MLRQHFIVNIYSVYMKYVLWNKAANIAQNGKKCIMTINVGKSKHNLPEQAL